MQSSNDKYQFSVLIKGKKPATEVTHNGHVYIEGRKNSSYELKFKNNTGIKVLIIPSVDGLNTLDGKYCGINSRGYVVDAWGEITIPGWLRDNGNETSAAKFIFKGQDAKEDGDKTYVEAIDVNPDNQGVVGLMVFPEKQYPIWRPRRPSWPDYWYNDHYGPVYGGWSNSVLRGSSANYSADINNMSFGASGTTSNSQQVKEQSAVPNESIVSAAQTMFCNASSNNSDVTQSFSIEETSLGTGYGKEVDFKTTTVNFVRENETTPDSTFVIYYDNIRGLKRKGIDVSLFRPKKKDVVIPQAFPASPQLGCKDPPGWKKR